jgi:hypothetical protein
MAPPLEALEVSKKLGHGVSDRSAFDCVLFRLAIGHFLSILSAHDLSVRDPDLCCDGVVVDAGGHCKCRHRRSRISFVRSSLLRRSLFFLDAGPPGVRFRLPLRLLLRLRQSAPLSARTMETVMPAQRELRPTIILRSHSRTHVLQYPGLVAQ